MGSDTVSVVLLMPAEPAEQYTKGASLAPTVSDLLQKCCEDLPETLQPYLLAKLCELYPAAADGVTFEDPQAKVWKPSGKKIFNKKELIKYLEDLRWTPTVEAITEQVI